MMLPNSIAICFTLYLVFGEATFVSIPFKKRWYDNKNKPLMEKKSHLIIRNANAYVKRESPDAYFDVETKYNQLFYEVEMKIGSQKGPVTLLLDTGSSDIIVNSAENNQCIAEDDSGEDDGDDADDQNDQSLQKREDYAGAICIVQDGSGSKFTSELTTSSFASSSTAVDPTNSPSEYPKLKKNIKYASDNDDYLNAIAPKIDPLYDCFSFGVFNQSSSDTFEKTNVPLDIEYYDGLGAIGMYGKDTVYLGDVEIPQTIIGLNTESYLAKGVLGIGFSSNQNAFQNGHPKYDSFPEHLTNIGLINKPVFSIYGMYGKPNSVLFGAYDKSAYIKDKGLTLVPIAAYNPGTKVGDAPYYVSLTVSSISFTSSKLENLLIASGKAVALLDTGASYSTVPYYILNEILTKFGFKWSSQLETFVISESEIPKEQVFLTFDFQSAKIEIPLIDFTYPIVDGQTLSNTGLRSISIEAGNDDTFILGDDFLNSVYLIVDQKEKTAALGQANPNKHDSDIQIVNDNIADALKSPEYDETYGYKGVKKLSLVIVDDPNDIETVKNLDKNLQLYQPGLGNDLDW